MAGVSRIKNPVIIAGVIAIVAGMVFGLQGQGVLGPEESFMHADPQWYAYGNAIMTAGVIMVLAGAIIMLQARLACGKKKDTR